MDLAIKLNKLRNLADKAVSASNRIQQEVSKMQGELLKETQKGKKDGQPA